MVFSTVPLHSKWGNLHREPLFRAQEPNPRAPTFLKGRLRVPLLAAQLRVRGQEASKAEHQSEKLPGSC